MPDPIELNGEGEPEGRFTRALTFDYTGGAMPSWMTTGGQVSGQTDPTFTPTWDGFGFPVLRMGAADSSVSRRARIRTPTFNPRTARMIRIRAAIRVPHSATKGQRTVVQQMFTTPDSTGFQYGKLSGTAWTPFLYAKGSASGFLRTHEATQAEAGVYQDQSLWIDVLSRTVWTGVGDSPGSRATLSEQYFSLGSIGTPTLVLTGVGDHAGVDLDVYRFRVDVWADAR